MIQNYRAIREVANKIDGAVKSTLQEFNDEQFEQEPSFTDRMLGRVACSIDGFKSKGISWSAKTLNALGPGAQETAFGADFMGVLKLDLNELKAFKGFLAQAKLLKNGKIDNKRDLKEQCEKMLSYSPASFVFLYDKSDVRIIPAVSVCGCNTDLTKLYSSTVKRFFENHLECFIGDREISASNNETLR